MTPQETVGEFIDEAAGERSDRRPSQAHPAARAHPRAPRAIRSYRRWRGATGVLLVALIFAAGWLLNGYFTARTVAALGGDWLLGWAIHLIITAVELTTALIGPALRAIRAPLWVHVLLWAVVLPLA